MKNIKSTIKWPFVKFGNLGRKAKIFVIFLILLLIYWQYNSYKNSGLVVETDHARIGKIVETIDASGEITAANSANLTFQTSGQVKEVNFGEGDHVKKGDVIAKLDTTLLYASYQQADATLRAAKAALDSTYDTLQGKEGTETYAEISTRTAAETAKDKAYWAYVAAAKALEGAYIKAPFDGVLTQVPDNIVAGSIVTLPGGSVFQVVGPRTVYFDAEVNELDIAKLTSGSKALIELDAYPDREFEGLVSGYNILSTTTSTGGTAYNATVSILDSDSEKFLLGMNGDVSIILTEKEDVLLIPLTAIIEDGDDTYVWEAVNGQAVKVKIETGISSINETEVLNGLSEKDIIIMRPPSNIEEGMKLKLK